MIQKVSTLIIGIVLFIMMLVLINFKCSPESSIPENLFSENINSDEPIVCTLTEDDLVKRKEKLKQEIFSKAIKKEEVNNGYIFYFKDEEGMLRQLTNFIIDEQKCCKFFHYDLSIQSNGKGIAVKISGPLGAKMMIESL